MGIYREQYNEGLTFCHVSFRLHFLLGKCYMKPPFVPLPGLISWPVFSEYLLFWSWHKSFLSILLYVCNNSQNCFTTEVVSNSTFYLQLPFFFLLTLRFIHIDTYRSRFFFNCRVYISFCEWSSFDGLLMKS